MAAERTPSCCWAWPPGTPCHPVSLWQPDISHASSLQTSCCSQQWSQTRFLTCTSFSVFLPGLDFGSTSCLLSPGLWIGVAPCCSWLASLLASPQGLGWDPPTGRLFRQPQIAFECSFCSPIIQLLSPGKREQKARESETLGYNTSSCVSHQGFSQKEHIWRKQCMRGWNMTHEDSSHWS